MLRLVVNVHEILRARAPAISGEGSVHSAMQEAGAGRRTESVDRLSVAPIPALALPRFRFNGCDLSRRRRQHPKANLSIERGRRGQAGRRRAGETRSLAGFRAAGKAWRRPAFPAGVGVGIKARSRQKIDVQYVSAEAAGVRLIRVFGRIKHREEIGLRNDRRDGRSRNSDCRNCLDSSPARKACSSAPDRCRWVGPSSSIEPADYRMRRPCRRIDLASRGRPCSSMVSR